MAEKRARMVASTVGATDVPVWYGLQHSCAEGASVQEAEPLSSCFGVYKASSYIQRAYDAGQQLTPCSGLL